MNNEKKPSLLLATLILTSIVACLTIILLLIFVLFFDSSINYIRSITNLLATEGITKQYLIILLVLNIASLFGISKIWQYRKIGFYIFAISQFVMLIYPLFQLNYNASSSINSIFVIIVIFIYVYYIFVSKNKSNFMQ